VVLDDSHADDVAGGRVAAAAVGYERHSGPMSESSPILRRRKPAGVGVRASAGPGVRGLSSVGRLVGAGARAPLGNGPWQTGGAGIWQPDCMTRYEYAKIWIGRQGQVYVALPGADVIERSGPTIVEVMNDLGRDGWELVTSSASAHVAGGETHTFRRVVDQTQL
jgi:hypothetical protein